MPLDYKLKNGNIVEILTSSTSTGPSRDWLKIVKSSQAKNKIRQWFKREERELNINRGKEMLEKELKRQGYKLAEILKEDWLKNIASKLNLNTSEDLYAALGYGSVTLSQVIQRLKEFYKDYYKIDDEKIENEKLSEIPQIPKKKKKVTQGVSIRGVDNVKIRFAKCCNPVPGDEIIGYITRGRGLSIHRKDCPNILDLTGQERFIDVEWDTDEKAEYPVEIQIKATDRPGLLADITQGITDSNISLLSLNARTSKEKLVLINMILEIKDTEQLKELMKRIRKLKGVIDVYRVIS